MKCYSMFDKKFGQYVSLDYFSNDDIARRHFENFVRGLNEVTSYVYHHLDEYSVYCVGDFNINTGEIKPSQPVVAFELLEFSGCLRKEG